MRFRDKVVIITGGSEGVGKAAAVGFAKEGATVVITSRSKEKLDAAKKEIQLAGGKVTIIPGDVTDDDHIYAVVNRTLKEHNRVDILFNYAGGSPDLKPVSLFVEEDKSYWEKMIRLNLWSTMIFCRAVLDPMMQQKYGKIINTSAMAGKIGSERMVAYSAVKGGVIAFTKALALEMAPYNININCICPGPIDTPGAEKVTGAILRRVFNSSTPQPSRRGINRIATPWEVASAVLYLASDDAAYITGQPLSVDGGMTMV